MLSLAQALLHKPESCLSLQAFNAYVTSLRGHSTSGIPVPPKVVVERRWQRVDVDLALAELPSDGRCGLMKH